MTERAPSTTKEVCPLCGEPRTKAVLVGRDRLHGLPGRFELAACESCGLWRQRPFLTNKEAERFYPPDYRPYLDGRPVPAVPRDRLSHRLRRRYVEWIRRDRPRLASMDLSDAMKTGAAAAFAITHAFRFNPFSFRSEGGRVLDVGCADGMFLAEMAALGWRPFGVEVNEDAADRARERGAVIWTGAFPEAAEAAAKHGPFDLVTLRQVIEHMSDPAAAARAVLDLLVPGGFLAVWTPNRRSVAARVFKDCWHNLDLPRHQVLFHRKALTALLRQAGFSVRFEGCFSSAKSLARSLACRISERRGDAAGHRIEQSRIVERGASICARLFDLAGWGDAVLVLAIRPHEHGAAEASGT